MGRKSQAFTLSVVLALALTAPVRAQAAGETKLNPLSWVLVPAASEPNAAISTDGSDPDSWNPTLDGPLAAAANHKIIYEDSDVRVLLVNVRPGEKENVHHHRWPSIWVALSTLHATADFNAAGKQLSEFPRDIPADLMAQLKSPLVLRFPPQSSHAGKNLDLNQAVRAIRIEYKHGFPN